ncbi:GNAT family N-acetyltransferase [Lysinibacillus sp. NPDC096418]|uniref:GNAT family N-acetyltransferase n=1 Tax=Lysinibacillus sp. NPDC096418 TaxID=3364138 RepID=UPI00380DB699
MPDQINTFLSMQWRAQQLSYSQQFPNANHYIVLYENEYVGRCIIEDLLGHFRLVDLSIFSSFQGKGIGTFIIELLQQRACKYGKPVTLQVFHENSARLLYERLGFRVVEANGLYVRIQWQEI